MEPVNIGLVTVNQSLIKREYPKSIFTIRERFVPSKVTDLPMKTDPVIGIVVDTQNGQKFYSKD